MYENNYILKSDDITNNYKYTCSIWGISGHIKHTQAELCALFYNSWKMNPLRPVRR